MGLSPNKPSCKNDAAKIQMNRETAINNLKNLEKSYTNIEQLYGFLRNIKTALGLQQTKGASEYGIVKIQQDNGKVLIASISISNHHTKAQTYIDKNSNCEYNLRIVVKKSKIKGKFVPNDNVVLDEYSYTGGMLRKTNNSLSLIIQSIIGFLNNGIYEDLTGIAVVRHSPNDELQD